MIKPIRLLFISALALVSAQPITARYVRVYIESIGLCPSWHYGVGYPVWAFVDEVVVE